MFAPLLAIGLIVGPAAWDATPERLSAGAVGGGGIVAGRVVDARTREPIVGARVELEGTNRATLTNASGRYRFDDVSPGTYTVAASFLGYGTGRREHARVRAGEVTEIVVELIVNPLRLQELVVTGLTDPTSGVKAPFIVDRIGVEELHVPQLDVLSALQGRVAGVTMVRGGGQPGDDYDIILRTPTSIMRSNHPLIVLDGTILGTGSLTDLDGLDIETIEVVKGAAAASLYGSRAAGGVIEVRTRTGAHLNEGDTRFSFRTEVGREEIPPDRRRRQLVSHHHPFLVNDDGDYVNESGEVVDPVARVMKADGIADQPYKTIHDHLSVLFRPGLLQSNSLSMTQNTSQTRFYASVTSHEQTGLLRHNDGLSRRSIRLNLSHWPQSQLNLAMTGYYSRTRRDEVADPNPFWAVKFMPPDIDLTVPDPEGARYVAVPAGHLLYNNPLYNQFYNESEGKHSRFIGGMTATYSPNRWLRLEGNMGVDRFDREDLSFWPVGFRQATSEVLLGGEIYRRHRSVESFTSGVNARTLHQFGRFTVRNHVRAIFELDDRETTTARGRDLAVSGVKNLAVANDRIFSSSTTMVRSEGYSAAVAFDYAERFVGDLLVRRDGSSLFGPDDRWNTYYRASGAYRVAQERWWPIGAVTEFKLRYSVGTAGGRPNFADRFETWAVSGGQPSKQTLGNRLLRPEKATEREAGVDLILRDRLSLQLTRAETKVEDQILPIPLPGVLGYSHQWQNAGTLEGTTYEATLEAALLSRSNSRWSVHLTWDRSRHAITEWPLECYTEDIWYRCAGWALGSIRGRPLLRNHGDLSAIHANSHHLFQVNDDGWLVAVGEGNHWTDGIARGLWGTTVVIDGRTYEWGKPIPAINDDGSALFAEIGNSQPDFQFGFGTRAEWGRVSLGGLLDGSIGGVIRNYEKHLGFRDFVHPDVDQGHKPDERKKPLDYYSFHTDALLEDASFVKLRELSLTYQPDTPRWLRAYGMRRTEISLMARNLYTWSRFSGWDPEVGTVLQREYRGTYPQMRTLSIGARVDF